MYPANPAQSRSENLHRQHVSARSKRHVDVAQSNLLKKELVTFFSLYRRDDLGRADDLLREWKSGRELEDINRELKKSYQHNLFDLHEIDSTHPILHNPLEAIILAERLKRAQVPLLPSSSLSLLLLLLLLLLLVLVLPFNIQCQRTTGGGGDLF